MARSGIIYGQTGSYKTTAIKHFSHYIYEKTGKKTLLFSIDGGGWEVCIPEIKAGIISPYRCTTDMPLQVMRKISQGYWPVDPEETRSAKINVRRIDWDEYGGLAVESLTSFSNAIMAWLNAKGPRVGNEARLRYELQIYVDGTLTTENFGSNSQGDYGSAQGNIYQSVMNFISLPCDYVLFTALESRSEEEDRSTTYGPQIAGKKATAQAPTWVGDCIHSEVYTREEITKVKNEKTGEIEELPTIISNVRSYYLPHPDPITTVKFPAKPRVTPERMEEFKKIYPGGFYVPTLKEGFDKYLRTIDQLSEGASDEMKAWREQMDAKHGRGKKPELGPEKKG